MTDEFYFYYNLIMKANFDILNSYSEDYFKINPEDSNIVKPNYKLVWNQNIKGLKQQLEYCKNLMLIETSDDNYDMFEILDAKSSWQSYFNNLTSMLTDKARQSLHDWQDINNNLSSMFSDYNDSRLN